MEALVAQVGAICAILKAVCVVFAKAAPAHTDVTLLVSVPLRVHF